MRIIRIATFFLTMYICMCNGVTEHDVRACAEQGACSLRDLELCLGVGAGCGRCRLAANEVLKNSRPNRTGELAAGSTHA